MVDLSTVPLTALSIKSKQVICNLLNPTKYIPCENGLPRDWRGLAHLSDLEGEIMPMLSSHPDPTMFILQTLEKRGKQNLTSLQDMLSMLDRWDIIDDAQDFIEEDAVKYLEHLQNSQTTTDAIEDNVDAKVLTVDDLYRTRQGLENQRYDAFVLYANEDMDFANEMIDKLEKYNIKLCIKDRDLIGGITFEHEAVMTLISERCNRLIVIVSPDFIKSSANKFFLNYAQAVSIDKRQRKIIPCLYKKCALPPQLSYMFILDYTRVGLYDFWGRLRDSIQVPNTLQNGDIKVQSLKDKEDTIQIENKSQYGTTYPETETLQLKKCNNALDHQNSDFVAQSKLTKSTENLSDSVTEKQKRNGFLKWTKRKLKLKENTKKRNFETITETLTIDSLPSLPSLDNLDKLSITIDTANAATNKSKEKISKKRKTLKQILLKS
ncbi:hypothetical protein KPH14_008023 [Odynerus spinipes]|uniref:TIR domain-containing protein n=1 Tax=Odynerus spinipes TaxID=1348599 RepID=A0AAD9RK43_9HYME|nr:hypothetical protein KPH14_008023 [Odynerus spinipes]